jgi:hypothetical protein
MSLPITPALERTRSTSFVDRAERAACLLALIGPVASVFQPQPKADEDEAGHAVGREVVDGAKFEC